MLRHYKVKGSELSCGPRGSSLDDALKGVATKGVATKCVATKCVATNGVATKAFPAEAE